MATTLAHLLLKLGADSREFRTALTKAEKDMKAFASATATFGNAMTIGVTVPMVAAGAAALKMGLDQVEAKNLVVMSFGGMTTAAEQWAAGLSTSLGLNRFELEKNAALLHTMTKSMGLSEQEAYKMATGLTELAADMESFYNLPHGEALEKLRAGLTGEAEPLKRLGILVNEVTVKQVAWKAGIAAVGTELTETQKVQARYLAMMQATTTAQGDLARTIDSPANQLRMLQAQLTQTATEFGMALLPALQDSLPAIKELADYVAGAMRAFAALEPEERRAALTLAAVVAAIGPVSRALSFVAANGAATTHFLRGVSAEAARLATTTASAAAGTTVLTTAQREAIAAAGADAATTNALVAAKARLALANAEIAAGEAALRKSATMSAAQEANVLASLAAARAGAAAAGRDFVAVTGNAAAAMVGATTVVKTASGGFIGLSSAQRKVAAEWPKLEGGMSLAKAGMIGLTAVISYQITSALEPLITKWTGLGRALGLVANSSSDFAEQLTASEDVYREQLALYDKVRNGLQLTGEEWRIQSEFTKENASRLAALIPKVLELQAAKVRETAAHNGANVALDAETQKYQAAAQKMIAHANATNKLTSETANLYGVITKKDAEEQMRKLAADFALLAKEGASTEQLMAAFGPRVEDLAKVAGGYKDLAIPADFRALNEAVKAGGPAFDGLVATMATKMPEGAKQGSGKAIEVIDSATGKVAASLSGGFGKGIEDGVKYGEQAMDEFRKRTEMRPINIPVNLIFPDDAPGGRGGMGLGGG